jgi:predicted nucleotidyltransferase
VLRLRRLLEEMLGPDFVCLYHYGSRVEGGAEPESDYDVACVTKRPLDRDEIDRIIDRTLDIQMDEGVVFDLHFYSEQEIETAPLSHTPFVQWLRDKGVLV